MRARYIVRATAVGALLVAGLTACGGAEDPAVTEPTSAVEATEPAAEPTPEPVDFTVPGTVVPSREEAEAAGVQTYRTSAGQRITVDPAQELPQNVQDDFAAVTDFGMTESVLSQFNDIGVTGMYIKTIEDPGLGTRFTVLFNTGTRYSPDSLPPWSERIGALAEGFATVEEARAFAAQLRESYAELGALPLYDLTD